jgi:hypothetical protein
MGKNLLVRQATGYRFTGSQVHRFTGSQVHRFTGSQVQRFKGFTGSGLHIEHRLNQ